MCFHWTRPVQGDGRSVRLPTAFAWGSQLEVSGQQWTCRIDDSGSVPWKVSCPETWIRWGRTEPDTSSVTFAHSFIYLIALSAFLQYLSFWKNLIFLTAVILSMHLKGSSPMWMSCYTFSVMINFLKITSGINTSSFLSSQSLHVSDLHLEALC